MKNALHHNQLLAENRQLREELAGRFDFSKIIGTSALMNLLETVKNSYS
ncbi:MAG: hypothetical protein R2864_02640 [Syntrophotaleaceae bacterium]